MTRADDKENKILEAAIPLFVAQGLRRTTVEQIAEAAGIGKGTVYLYFKGKQEIFTAIARQLAEQIYQKVRSAVRRETTAVGQVRAYLRTRVQGVSELLQLYKVSEDFINETRAEIDILEIEWRQVERGILADILEGGVERGEFVVDDVPLACVAISASLKALEEPWWYQGRELGVEKKVDVLVNLFINGLQSRPGR